VTIHEAREILMLFRPWTADADNPAFAEALALAREDAGLRIWFERHCATQQEIREQFQRVAAPADLRRRILSEHAPRQKVIWWLQPVPLAAAAAVLLLGVLTAVWFNRPGPPPTETSLAAYRSRVVRTVLRTYTMDLEANDLAQIRSFLAAHSAHADYSMPDGLRHAPTTGCGVLTWQGKKVAMICFRSGKPLPPPEMSDLFLFVIDRDAVADAPGGASRQFQQVSRLATASWSAGSKVYVLAVEGDEALLRKFL